MKHDEEKPEKLPASLSKAVVAEINAMRAAKVVVTPRNLRDRAKKQKGTQLHKAFRFDDDKAVADEWRIDFARRLLASITITVAERPYPVRAYQSVVVKLAKGDGSREWFPRAEILNDAAKVASVSADMYGQATALAKAARDATLDKRDRSWKLICAAIEENPPLAVQ